MNEKLTEKLKKIDFIKGQNLFSVDDAPQNPYIRISLLDTKKLFPEVSHVYYRRFPQDSRPPLAQAFIFDFSDQFELPEDFGKTVKNIWLTGKIPLIYAFTKTEVNIISGYKQPSYKDDSYDISILDKIELADLANNKIFSAKRLDNGSFWDDDSFAKHFDFKQSPYEILLNKIKQMLENVVEKEDKLLPRKAKPFYQKLLLRSILVKYLEDRRDETGGVFREGYFSEIANTEDKFIYVLKQPGAIIELFKNLEKDFNGNIFALSNYEKIILQNKDLSAFTDVFDGYVDEHSQMHIWELYSFNYLPIELISNIYEEFMPKVDGVVYTPPFLVDFLIDQSMPFNDLIKRDNYYKVIDPACGSGVFLVAAFKRLVQAWKIKKKSNKPSIKILKDILSNSIFGIDNQKESIELAAFSLTIALCDQLSPKIIRDLQFEDLTKTNLLNQDFFSVILNKENKYNEFQNSFDLVIGNPPFTSEHTEDSNIIEQSRQKIKLPTTPKSNRIALLFLEQSLKIAKDGGKICLLMPSETLLYRDYYNYRNYFFLHYHVKEIFDFTPLRRVLFSATVAVACFMLINKKVSNKITNHIVVKRTNSSREKLFFEIDKYDCFNFPTKTLINNPFVFKCNLMGGHRINKIVNDFMSLHQKLSEFINTKHKQYPRLLIKQNIGLFKLKNQIISNSTHEIYADLKSETAKFYARDVETLFDISHELDKHYDFYKFFILCTSQRAALSKSYSTILVKDIENLPYIKNVEFSEFEKILINDTINYHLDYIRFGENSKILKKIPNCNNNIINDFSTFFLKVINSVYKDFHPADPIKTTSFICFPFYYGDTPEDDLEELRKNEEKLEIHLQNLINSQSSSTLRINRVLRIYNKNIIYLIKPYQLRYWLRSIAIRDADETVADFIEQGL